MESVSAKWDPGGSLNQQFSVLGPQTPQRDVLDQPLSGQPASRYAPTTKICQFTTRTAMQIASVGMKPNRKKLFAGNIGTTAQQFRDSGTTKLPQHRSVPLAGNSPLQGHPQVFHHLLAADETV